jgi:hypothetical protein
MATLFKKEALKSLYTFLWNEFLTSGLIENSKRIALDLSWRPLVKNSCHRKSSEARFPLALGATPLPRAGRGLERRRGLAILAKTRFFVFFGLFWKKTRKNGSGRNGTPPYGTNFLKRDGFLALNFSMARIFDQRPPRVVISNNFE